MILEPLQHIESNGLERTGQGTEERLLLRMTPHMRLQRISARVIDALSRTIAPLACILCPLRTDVLGLHVRDQTVAVPHLASLTPVPLTRSDLIRPHRILIV